MQFLVNAADLSKIMMDMGGVLKSNKAESYQYFSVFTQEESVTITAKNAFSNKIETIPAQVKEAGEICLPFNHVKSIFELGDRVMEFSTTVDSAEVCTITAGKAKFDLMLVIHEKDFYTPDLSNKPITTFQIDQSQLVRCLQKANVYSVAEAADDYSGVVEAEQHEENNKYMDQGIYAFVRDGKLLMCTYNHRMMSLVEVEVHTYDSIQDCGFIIPTKTAEELKKLKKVRGLWRITVQAGHAVFSNGSVQIATKTLPEPKIDFDRYFKATNQEAVIYRKAFQKACDRIATIIKNKDKSRTKPIVIKTVASSQPSMIVSSEFQGYSANETCEAFSVDGEFEFKCDQKMLDLILDGFDQSQMGIGFSAADQPLQFVEEHDGILCKYTMQPMKL